MKDIAEYWVVCCMPFGGGEIVTRAFAGLRTEASRYADGRRREGKRVFIWDLYGEHRPR